MMTTDTHQWTKGLTLVTDLILDVSHKYRVDKDRIYGTGQSQGGMANIAISDAYPDLFAGQYLVACQWDTQEMEKLKDKNLWITVCQGDTKAFPGMNEATALWEKDGAVVARSRMWDSTGGTPVFEQMMRVMEDQQTPINYTVFQGGSHMYTWSFAYNIEGIRDWLFAQTKAKDVLKQTAPAQGAAQQGEKGHGPKGNPAGRALLNTGIAYLYGLGVAADTAKAKAWYQKAAATGNLDAIEALKAMGDRKSVV